MRVIPALGLLAALGLTGCTDYLERRQTIALEAGDAARANAAIHTIDPWPAAAQRTTLSHDGERLARVYERYRTRQDVEKPGAAPVTLIAPTTPPGIQ
jgi:hypothetical protein